MNEKESKLVRRYAQAMGMGPGRAKQAYERLDHAKRAVSRRMMAQTLAKLRGARAPAGTSRK